MPYNAIYLAGGNASFLDHPIDYAQRALQHLLSLFQFHWPTG